MDGNYNSLNGTLKTLYFPAGKYWINQTINMQFRNYMTIEGESEFNTIISAFTWSGGAGINTMLDCKASNYVNISHLTLDGSFKCSNMIYCAGIDAAHTAAGSKGNVTGNEFTNLFFWNQPGDLITLGDHPDQFAQRSAMICLTTDSGADSSYYSCDDSYIRDCRFATNSVNNYFAFALSSSNLQIENCTVFAANGVLASNGCSASFRNMAWEIYGYQAIDATHNHAVLKFTPDTGGNQDAFGQGTITMTDCYFESGYNGPTVTTAILAYKSTYTGGGVGDFQPKMNLLFQGGLYSLVQDGVFYINIQGNNRGNIHISNVSIQGTNKPLVWCPDCSLYIEDQGFVAATSTGNYQTWEPASYAAYKSLVHKFTTPDYVVSGEDSPKATAYVGTLDYPAQLRFLSLDAALAWLCTSNCDIEIIMQKNDTIVNTIKLRGNITLDLSTFTVTVNAIVKNYGFLLVNGIGVMQSAGRNLYNYGDLRFESATIDTLVSNFAGQCWVNNSTFQGTDDTISVAGTSQVLINKDNCTFNGSQFVVSLASGWGDAILRSSGSTPPTTGKWARGTKFQTTLPSAGVTADYWACANGVGALAAWKSNGTLI